MNDIYEERNGRQTSQMSTRRELDPATLEMIPQAERAVNRHELDPAALEMLQQADMEIRAINDRVNGMLTYFAKARGLTAGQWRLSDNRRELVPVQQQQPL